MVLPALLIFSRGSTRWGHWVYASCSSTYLQLKTILEMGAAAIQTESKYWHPHLQWGLVLTVKFKANATVGRGLMCWYLCNYDSKRAVTVFPSWRTTWRHTKYKNTQNGAETAQIMPQSNVLGRREEGTGGYIDLRKIRNEEVNTFLF